MDTVGWRESGYNGMEGEWIQWDGGRVDIVGWRESGYNGMEGEWI